MLCLLHLQQTKEHILYDNETRTHSIDKNTLYWQEHILAVSQCCVGISVLYLLRLETTKTTFYMRMRREHILYENETRTHSSGISVLYLLHPETTTTTFYIRTMWQHILYENAFDARNRAKWRGHSLRHRPGVPGDENTFYMKTHSVYEIARNEGDITCVIGQACQV